MLRSVKDLIGYPVKALDGKIGKVADCLFDDRDMSMKYLVLNTGHHFRINFNYIAAEDRKDAIRKNVLVVPEQLEKPDLGWGRHFMPVLLRKSNIEHRPGVESEAPISKRYEDEFTKYYRHTPYGDRPNVWDLSGRYSYVPPDSNYDHSDVEMEAHEKRIREIAKCHIQSVKELLGYRIQATDGENGVVDDFILDDDRWLLTSFIVNLSRWIPGNKVILDTGTIRFISWSERNVILDMPKAVLRSSQSYDPREGVNEGESGRLFDYSGKPAKWTEGEVPMM